MDINVLRGLITVVSLVVFVGIVLWAWSGRQRKRFEEAAMLPFAERDVPPEQGAGKAGNTGGAHPQPPGTSRSNTNPTRNSAE